MKFATLWLCLALLAMTVCGKRAYAADDLSLTRLDGTTIRSTDVDATITRAMNESGVAGVAIVVIHKGEIAFLKTYGWRDKEKKLPLTINSVIPVGSFSNVVFAYTVMQLVAEGVLDLDKPISKYLEKPLPDYSGYQDLANDPRWKHITPRMLLDQTSGFADWRSSEADQKLKIHFKPGAQFAYSSEGADLLQLVAETRTQTHLEEMMQEHVFEALEMTRTSMVWNTAFATDYAHGYDAAGHAVTPNRNARAEAADSMLTSTADLARFLQAVLAEKLLRNKIREQMLSPQVQITSKHEFPTLNQETTEEYKTIRLSYGLGWGLYTTPYGRAFFKDGRGAGWSNYVVCFDQPKTAVMILTNSENGESIFRNILDKVLKDVSGPMDWEGFTNSTTRSTDP
jgi:CubicO group peptidase (beta-lactamase class C family)